MIRDAEMLLHREVVELIFDSRKLDIIEQLLGCLKIVTQMFPNQREPSVHQYYDDKKWRRPVEIEVQAFEIGRASYFRLCSCNLQLARDSLQIFPCVLVPAASVLR